MGTKSIIGRVKMVDENFLEVSKVYKSYGEGESKQEVLKGMDFKVKKGEFCVSPPLFLSIYT